MQTRQPVRTDCLLLIQALRTYSLVPHPAAPAMREIPLGSNKEALLFAARIFGGEIDVVIFLTGVGARALLPVVDTVHKREDYIAAVQRLNSRARSANNILGSRNERWRWQTHLQRSRRGLLNGQRNINWLRQCARGGGDHEWRRAGGRPVHAARASDKNHSGDEQERQRHDGGVAPQLRLWCPAEDKHRIESGQQRREPQDWQEAQQRRVGSTLRRWRRNSSVRFRHNRQDGLCRDVIRRDR